MALNSPSAFLIHTKLHRPRITAELVERPRLYSAMGRRRPLTIVAAPAGYGKTTLVNSWVERCGMRCAWLALDATDSKLNVFVDYLLGAIEGLFPAIAQRMAVGVNHGAAMSYAAVARSLANELDVVDESFALVLDDYHLISEPAIHRFLAELLRDPPRSLNLVISTRIEPPLPLSVMRANDQLTEVRAHDLRFTAGEMADYLHRVLDQPVDARTLTILEETTEGWIAGLHLAALFLRNQADIAGAAARFKGSNRFTIDYLTVEVLARQAPDVQNFLVKTSILHRMSSDLCDAIVGATSAAQQSQRILDQLETDDLFLVTLDDIQRWYRYHQLFQQLLEHRLRATHTAEEIATLYRTASRWCADHHQIDEAVTYALAAGEVAEAVRMMERYRHVTINEEKWQQLERWLPLMQRHDINAYPELLILEAWILHKRERLTEIPGRLDLAEAILDEGNRTDEEQTRLRSEIDALRSQQYFWQADGHRALESARRALTHAPADDAGTRGVAWVSLAGGICLTEGEQPALDALDRASAEEGQNQSLRSQLLIARCFVYWMAADMPNLGRVAENLLRLANQHNLPESLVWGFYFRGCALYQQNDVTAAAEDFVTAMSYRHSASSFAFVQGAFGLASALQAQGNPDGAQATVDTVLEYVQETNNAVARQTGHAFEAQVALDAGRIEDAWRWAANADRRFQPRPMPGFFSALPTISAILVCHGTLTALNEAEQLLRRLDLFLAATHNRLFRIEVLVQTASLYARRNRHDAARGLLEQAVLLAQPGNVRRTFLNRGAEIVALLGDMVSGGTHRAFVEQILQACVRPITPPPAQQPPRRNLLPSPVFMQPRHPDLIELLTNREMEVLQLLALRLTNKEIAQALGISTETVKQHAMNVFRKLHVENRRDAIVQARAMGFRFDIPNAL